MMGCFGTAFTDGTDESLHLHNLSLRAILASKQAPLPTPCVAKKLIERKLGLDARKTLRARSNLLDTAGHSLARAKQRTLISIPSQYIKTETMLFPLPLPPGYIKPAATKRITNSSSSHIAHAKSATLNTEVIKTSSSSFSSTSSNSPSPSSSLTSDLLSTSHSSCEALTPSSSTSSSAFSGDPLSSFSSSSSLSSCSSFSNQTSFPNQTSFRCNSLSHSIDVSSNKDNCSLPLPLPAAAPFKHNIYTTGSTVLIEFSPVELARACDNFGDAYKLRDTAMGPLFRAYVPINGDQKGLPVTIARVATTFSRKRWKELVQALDDRIAHPNLSKVIGYSYEKAKSSSNNNGDGELMINREKTQGGGGHMKVHGFIVYERGQESESLEELLMDLEKGHSHIGWSTRLHIATGIAQGLASLLQTPTQEVSHGDLTMSSIYVDISSNAKLCDFVFATSNTKPKVISSCDCVYSFGDLLLQLFDFVDYPQGGGSKSSKGRLQRDVCPSNDAKVVIDLATSCLLPEPSIRPSMKHVARVLQSIERTIHVPIVSLKRSKSFTYRKRRSLSFG